MKITEDQVEKIASLARLRLEDSEVQLFAREFGQILDFFSLIDEYHDQLDEGWRADLLGDPTPEREDHPREGADPDALIQQSAKHQGRAILVPKILE